MAAKVHKIHSLPTDAPWQGGLPPEQSPENPLYVRALDTVLRVQRPAVLAHLRSVRLRNPNATPAQLIRIVELRYLAAVTSTGAAVGATAVIPGIGTGITLALSGAETVGFLESTALFAQSVAEIHGIQISDPDRARALVLTLMLGSEGTQLIAQLAGQATGKVGTRSAFWGETVAKSIPRAAMGPVLDQLKREFFKQFAKRGAGSFLGKALPFGVGAVIGAGGNNLLGRRVVGASRSAFGPAPLTLSEDIEPRLGAQRMEHRVVGVAGRAARAVGSAADSTVKRLRPRTRTADEALTAEPDSSEAATNH